jgi:hypothetical protein
MNKFRLFAILLTVALCVTFFVSCNKTGNDSVKIIEVNDIIDIPSSIATVTATIDNVGNKETLQIAEAVYQNNRATLKLSQKTLPASFLVPVEEQLSGYTISNKKARISSNHLEFYAYDSDGESLGYFEVEDEQRGVDFTANWFYVDRNVVITGKKDDVSVDLDLKKGWNIIYYRSDYRNDIESYTSQKPSEMNFTWQY